MPTRESSDREQLVDKLKEIGTILKQARIEKSLSLEEIARKTQIRISLLKAIESGSIETLPEPIYTRGLIKQFADTLGLNGEDISKNLPLSYASKFLKPSWIKISPTQVRPLHLYLLYILLVISSVNYISYLLHENTFKTADTTIREQIDKGLISSSNSNSIPVSSIDKNIDANNSSSEQSLRVGIALKSSSWIRVVADGKTEFEGVLKSGQHRTWVAKQQLTISAKNAGGVMVALNDTEAKQLGKPGQPKQVTFGYTER